MNRLHRTNGHHHATLVAAAVMLSACSHTAGPGEGPPLIVQQVTFGSPALRVRRGDVVQVDVRATGPGGRVVHGRPVSLITGSADIAVIDGSGRLRAVREGTTTVRATVDGVAATAALEVTAENATFALHAYNGQTLPAIIATDSVKWDGVPEYQEVIAESGTLTLTGGSEPRYVVDVSLSTYAVFSDGGARRRVLRARTREFDRGIVTYDTRGDLHLTSEFYSPLDHTASAGAPGFLVRYRIPGADIVIHLFYRRAAL